MELSIKYYIIYNIYMQIKTIGTFLYSINVPILLRNSHGSLTDMHRLQRIIL